MGHRIYVSGAPCPMCMSAIYWARIDAALRQRLTARPQQHRLRRRFQYRDFAKPFDEPGIAIRQRLRPDLAVLPPTTRGATGPTSTHTGDGGPTDMSRATVVTIFHRTDDPRDFTAVAAELRDTATAATDLRVSILDRPHWTGDRGEFSRSGAPARVAGRPGAQASVAMRRPSAEFWSPQRIW